MTKLVSTGQSGDSSWDPESNTIFFGESLGSKLPIVLSHEISHVKLGHGPSYSSSTLIDFYEERDAWKESIRTLLPSEIKIETIKRALGTYLTEVEKEYGESSAQYSMARNMFDNVLEYARKRKKEKE